MSPIARITGCFLIAKIGGWEDISTLQKIYQHSTKTAEEAAAETIREQFEKIAG